MSVKAILEALVEAGIDADEIKEAAEELGGKSKGKKGDKGGKEKKEEKGKGKKGKVTAESLLEDLDKDELVAVAVELELAKEKKAEKMDEDELRELIGEADVADIEAAIEEAVGEGSGEDEDYEDMTTEQLVELVVERDLLSEKKAAKLDDEELIKLLEEADDEE